MSETSAKRSFLNPDWYMVILTALTLAVGLATLVVFYRQFREMTKQTEVLNKQLQQAAADSSEATGRLQKQLDIARQQASATEETVRTMRRQMRQDQRAWVKGYTDKNWPIRTGEPLETTFHTVNLGKTAARKVNVEVVISLLRSGESPTLTFPHQNNNRTTTGTLFPNDAILDLRVVRSRRGSNGEWQPLLLSEQ